MRETEFLHLKKDGTRCARESKWVAMQNKEKVSYVSKQHKVSEEWRWLWVFDATTLQNGIWIDGIPLKEKIYNEKCVQYV